MKNATAPEKTLTGEEILIIEDDSDIVELLTMELTKHHYRVRVALEGQKGLAEARRQPPELVILDLMLPGLDGWEVCRLLKNNASTKAVPLLILTAMVQEEDRVRGLELGADDYLVKPFSLKELVARVRALLRRTRTTKEDNTTDNFKIGPLSLDIERHEVRMADRLLQITPTEFALLKHLIRHPGIVFTRDQLISALWGEDRFVEEHNLDVHVHSLRQQLETDPAHPRFLLTVRGVGYKLQIPEEP